MAVEVIWKPQKTSATRRVCRMLTTRVNEAPTRRCAAQDLTKSSHEARQVECMPRGSGKGVKKRGFLHVAFRSCWCPRMRSAPTSCRACP